jgi:hypothetical protein
MQPNPEKPLTSPDFSGNGMYQPAPKAVNAFTYSLKLISPVLLRDA